MTAGAIRAATEADLEVVMQLFEELERAQGSLRIFPVAGDAHERFRDSFLTAIASPHECFLLAEDAGAALGMAHCKVERPSKLSDARVIEIGRLVVIPEARGRSIGRALCEAAADFGRRFGIEVVSARVFAGNEQSLEFWRRLGFEPFVETLVRRRPEL